jgi:hypothetical protein
LTPESLEIMEIVDRALGIPAMEDCKKEQPAEVNCPNKIEESDYPGCC